uniref:SH3 domain-binding protein 4-like n=1 Tax=Styela clava TaxID=7725 RepID=UPI00193A61A4|nr:SH3 domain-binding protein 4-like [Styela clava]
MRYNNKTQNSPTRNSQSPKRKSYYVAADEISPDLDILDFAKSSSTDPSHNSDGSSTPSNGSSLFQSSPCLPNSRVYDAWAEVGADGGVVQIPGSGTSLHFLPNLKLNDTEKHLLKQKSMSTLDLHRTIKNSAGNSKPEDNIDGRVFIGLEDPPDYLNNDTRIIVGPMVRVDYGNYGIMSSGAVLQIDVNATVKSSVENDSTICEFTCLRSNFTGGEFKEIKGSYYHYGNTLQVSISPDITDQMTRIPGNGGSMCLVPLVKLSKGALLTEPSISVWDKISTKTFWVGIYGPKRPHQASTCCVSMSSASTSPPTLWIKKSSKNMFMHLWSSYQVALQKPQEIQILIQPEPSSSAIVASCLQDEDDLIGENEIRTKSRINRLFTIKYPKEVKRPLRERNSSESDSSLNYSCEKQNNHKDKLTLSIVGVHSKNILNEICFVVPKRASSCSTPIKRWKRTICSAPPKSIQGGRVQDYMYLWHEAQREAKTKLQPISKIPGADRRISITRVAVAITSRTRSKSVSGIAPHLAQYSQSDIMPILSMNTLWAHGTNHYKEWYVGVSQGKVGLIHTKCVRVFDTDQCYDGMEGRISVSELVENIIEPVGSLKYDYASFREKLLEHVDDWTIFGSNLQFGENYITRVCRGMKDDSKRETRDKLSLFLERYKDYCDTGPRKRLFHKEIIRTLLYMEQYDLVTSLIADFCFLTLSTEIGERWGGLLTILDGTKSLCRGNDVTNGKWRSKSLSDKKKLQHKKSGAVTCDKEIDRTNQNICKQAIKYLSIWRHQFNNNHIKELINLHHAVDELEESPNRTSRFLTSAIILIFSIESLRKRIL